MRRAPWIKIESPVQRHLVAARAQRGSRQKRRRCIGACRVAQFDHDPCPRRQDDPRPIDNRAGGHAGCRHRRHRPTVERRRAVGSDCQCLVARGTAAAQRYPAAGIGKARKGGPPGHDRLAVMVAQDRAIGLLADRRFAAIGADIAARCRHPPFGCCGRSRQQRRGCHHRCPHHRLRCRCADRITPRRAVTSTLCEICTRADKNSCREIASLSRLVVKRQ
jgi:hypothetical protein